jgi:hypothetical protein
LAVNGAAAAAAVWRGCHAVQMPLLLLLLL